MAHLTARSRRSAGCTIAGWLAILAVLAVAAPRIASVEDNSTANDPPAASDSVVADAVVRAEFPTERGIPALIVLRHADGLDGRDETEVGRITRALEAPDRPDSISAVVSTANTPQARPELESADGTTTTIVVLVTGSTSDASFRDAVDHVRDVAGRGTADRPIRVTGPAGIISDTVTVFGSANLVLLFATLILVLGLMLLIYRSPLLALMPLFAVGVAIQIAEGLGALAVKAGLFTVNSQAVSIMTVLLFGVGTDYCLFIVARYREECQSGRTGYAAMAIAMSRITPAIFSSASTVVLALLALLAATLPALRGFGPFLALSVAVMAVVSLTLVPATIALLGRAAFWPRPAPDRMAASASRSWDRIASAVTARPIAALLVSLVFLGIPAAGLLDYRDTYNFVTGFRVDTDSRQGQQLLERAFPDGRLAPATVLVQVPDDELEARSSELEEIRGDLSSVAGVAQVGPVELSSDGSAARFTVTYQDNPYEAPALERTASSGRGPTLWPVRFFPMRRCWWVARVPGAWTSVPPTGATSSWSGR